MNNKKTTIEKSKFTLEPSEPVELDIDKLRQISRSANKKNKKTKIKSKDISKKWLEVHIASMEKDIKDFAKRGLFEVSWDFDAINASVHQLITVAEEFKKRHCKFSIEIHTAKKKITISWR